MIFKLQGIFKKHRTAVSCGDYIMTLYAGGFPPPRFALAKFKHS